MRDRWPIFVISGAGLSFLALQWSTFSAVALGASDAMTGERQSSFFFTITHLHPAIYVGLFLVFLASLANLISQGWGLSHTSRTVALFKLFRRPPGTSRGNVHTRRPAEKTRISLGPAVPIGNRGLTPSGGEPVEAALLGVRRLGKVGEDADAPVTPTPLDGFNHPMPEFSSQARPRTGAPRTVESKTGETAPLSEFKFSSAVDVLTSEEMERREREQLAVSGTVTGPDGKGIGSVIVYLADEQGNRVGQLCRSVPETGEFKVLASEPGRYVLHGYKRGFLVEVDQPQTLPIQSGKIEGYILRLIPEGCLVVGKVAIEDPHATIPGYTLTCICKNQESPRSTQTETDGQFKIAGVPPDTECFLEIRTADGKLVTRSEPFQTVQKKEIYLELKLRDTGNLPPTKPSGLDGVALGHDGESHEANQSFEQTPGSSAPSH